VKDDAEFVRHCQGNHIAGAAECLDSYHEPIAYLRPGEPLLSIHNSCASVATHAWFHELVSTHIRYSLGDWRHLNQQVWEKACAFAREYILKLHPELRGTPVNPQTPATATIPAQVLQ
jgi:hypothetical protein